MAEARTGELQPSTESPPRVHVRSASPPLTSKTTPSLAEQSTGQLTVQATVQIPYTTFTPRQKRFITLLLCLTTLASPLTATIYFPLIPLLSTHFHTSVQAINLTVTVYIIFQAVSPAVFATLSDSLGRRPIYIVTFIVYILASLGLALNKNSYAALLSLRMVQSIGASAVMAIGYGVVADVCVPARRGSMLGPVLAATNLGPCIGPVIGGWVALVSGGFHWVFWSLMIFGVAMLTAIGLIFPETARGVVGNGSSVPSGWGKTWSSMLLSLWRGSRKKVVGRRSLSNLGRSPEKSAVKRINGNHKIINPLTCVRIIFWMDTALILWICASFYAVWYCVQTSIPLTFKDAYGFNDLEVGLSYLTGGLGVILGGLMTGKMMDRNYRITAKRYGYTIDDDSGNDIYQFPIEKARAQGSYYLLGIFVFALAGYGWVIQTHTHPSIPLILQGVVGFTCTCFLQTFSALLVDIFPESPSTAAASNNITRCALSALAVAILQPFVNALGRGWYFSFLSLVNGIGAVAAIWAVNINGKRWRNLRREKSEKAGNITSNQGTELSEV